MPSSHDKVQRAGKRKTIPDAQALFKFLPFLLLFCWQNKKSCDQAQSWHEKGQPKGVVTGTCDQLSAIIAATYHIWSFHRPSPWSSVTFLSLDADLALSSVLLLTYLAAPKKLLISVASLC